jgi:uncharacterized protein YciI
VLILFPLQFTAMLKILTPFVLAMLLQGVALAQDTARSPQPAIRQFWFVLLLKGANRTQDSASAARIQDGHMANMRRLYSAGKLKVAGPFGDDGDWRGLFIFDCTTRQEVEQLLQTDPAIRSGRLAYEIKPWYTLPTGSFAPGKPKEVF